MEKEKIKILLQVLWFFTGILFLLLFPLSLIYKHLRIMALLCFVISGGLYWLLYFYFRDVKDLDLMARYREEPLQISEQPDFFEEETKSFLTEEEMAPEKNFEQTPIFPKNRKKKRR